MTLFLTLAYLAMLGAYEWFIFGPLGAHGIVGIFGAALGPAWTLPIFFCGLALLDE